MSDFFDSSEDALAKQADKDEQSDNKFDPSQGDVFKGIFLKAEAYTKGKYEPTVVLTIRNAGDKEVGGIEPGDSGYFFAPTVLRRKLFEAEPAMGTPFILESLGSITPEKGGNPYKGWTLVTPTTQDEPDESARDRALWSSIGVQMASKPQQAQAPNAYGGGEQAASGEWKF